MTSMVPEITKDITPRVYTREDVWAKGGTIEDDDTIYWYAKGVQALKAKPITDPTSWWFFAGIHGFKSDLWHKYVVEKDAKKISDLPSSQHMKVFWDQCQHGTALFLPWHRGYLLAVEISLRNEIIKLGGPKTWALPYIDYISNGRLPKAFTDKTYEDRETGRTEDNPLFMQHRYPILDSWLKINDADINKIFEKLKNSERSGKPSEKHNGNLCTPQDVKNTLEYLELDTKPNFSDKDFARISQGFNFLNRIGNNDLFEKLRTYLRDRGPLKALDDVMSIDAFSHTSSNEDVNKKNHFLSFGGPLTNFMHGNWQHGAIESMPHDLVHILIGGFEDHDMKKVSDLGAMSNPDTAGLDPIFYLHHANVDRLWNIWATERLKKDPQIYAETNEYNAWNCGPIDRIFAMPILTEDHRVSYFEFAPLQVQNSQKIKIHNSNFESLKYSYNYDKMTPAVVDDEKTSANKMTLAVELSPKEMLKELFNRFVKRHIKTDIIAVAELNKGLKNDRNQDGTVLTFEIQPAIKDEVQQLYEIFTGIAKPEVIVEIFKSIAKNVIDIEKILALVEKSFKNIDREYLESFCESMRESIDVVNSANGTGEKALLFIKGLFDNRSDEVLPPELKLNLQLDGIQSNQQADLLVMTDEKGDIAAVTGLFGLKQASDMSEKHGGQGISRLIPVDMTLKDKYEIKIHRVMANEKLSIQQASLIVGA